jgi:hypothetical protein
MIRLIVPRATVLSWQARPAGSRRSHWAAIGLPIGTVTMSIPGHAVLEPPT